MSFKNTVERYYQRKGIASNKKRSHSKYVTTKDLLDKSDFKNFVEIYENNVTEFLNRIDDYNGYFSTQQIESLDYEDFSEHVFFDSAVEKTRYAYDRVLNDFPYDGSEYEIKQYLNGLDGFTKYILKEKISKSKNFLYFNGDMTLSLKDESGWLLNDYKDKKKKNILEFGRNDFSIEFWIYKTQEIENFYQDFFFIGSDADQYFKVYVEKTDDSHHIVFKSKSSSSGFKIPQKIPADSFVHVNFTKSGKEAKIYIDGKLQTKKQIDVSYGNISIDEDTNVKIGKIDNNSGFRGFVDELRVYIFENDTLSGVSNLRSDKKIHDEKNKNLFRTDFLKLCLRFNEPDGEYVNNNIVIDYSGNKLHGLISGVNNFNKNSGVTKPSNPMIYEDELLNIVLYETHSSSGKDQLISVAEEYDLVNPNSFWKLMPKNIFVEGSDFDNIEETYISNASVSSNRQINSGNKFGTSRSINQKIIDLMTIWARFFDEIKLYIDNVSEMAAIDYDKINGKRVDGVILPIALKMNGFDFREIFPFPLADKLEKKNLTHEDIVSSLSIRQIQNTLWKRFLINSGDYIKSKGTKRSIKSLFNSFGLEADKFIKIRENTGLNRLNIDNQYYTKKGILRFLNFFNNSQISSTSTTSNSLPEHVNSSSNKFLANKVLLQTSGLFYKQDADSEDDYFDHFDISGEWCYESVVFFDNTRLKSFNNKQSIFRLDSHYDNNDSSLIKPYINVYFERVTKESSLGKLKIDICEDGNIISSHVLVEKINFFNGSMYLTSLSRKKVKDNKYKYIFRVGNCGEESYKSSYDEKIINAAEDLSSLRILKSFDNSFKGFKISIGNYSYSNYIGDTNFEGLVSNIRFYNRSTDINEFIIKQKDLLKIASKDNDLKNLLLNINLQDFNFNQDSNIDSLLEGYYTNPGIGIESTKRIPLKSFIDKENLLSFESGHITSESQNLDSNDIRNSINDKIKNSTVYCGFLYVGSEILTTSGDVFTNSHKDIFDFRRVQFLKQNYNIDFPSTHNKFYINSFSEEKFKNSYFGKNISDMDSVGPDYLYSNDSRLSIDFSLTNFLNEEISKIIMCNDYFVDKLSISSVMYEDDYKSLSNTREIFFERLEKELEIPSLYQVYKFFDNVLEDLLFEAIPSKVNYGGFNFIYESHVLERSKYIYKMSDSRFEISPGEDESSYQNYHTKEVLKIRYDDLTDFYLHQNNESSVTIEEFG